MGRVCILSFPHYTQVIDTGNTRVLRETVYNYANKNISDIPPTRIYEMLGRFTLSLFGIINSFFPEGSRGVSYPLLGTLFTCFIHDQRNTGGVVAWEILVWTDACFLRQNFAGVVLQYN